MTNYCIFTGKTDLGLVLFKLAGVTGASLTSV